MLLCAVLVDYLGTPVAGSTMPSAHVHSTLKACCAHQAANLNDMCISLCLLCNILCIILLLSTLKLVISASCDPPEHTAMLMQA